VNQLSRTILTEVSGEIIWSRKCKLLSFRFATISDLRSFNIDVTFNIVVILLGIREEFVKVQTVEEQLSSSDSIAGNKDKGNNTNA
jgi:hypothetical protein